MKKMLRFTAMAAVAALTLFSCQKEMEDSASGQAKQSGAGAYRVCVEVPVPESEKTSLGTYQGHDYVVLWGLQEQMMLAVTAGSSSVFASSQATDAFDGRAHASFDVTVDPPAACSYLYQGIYPAGAVLSEGNTDPSAFKVRLPDHQQATAASYDPSAFVMIARPESFDSRATRWQASFRRATALNRIALHNLPEGVSFSRVDVIAPEEYPLAGVRSFNLSTGESGSVTEGVSFVSLRYAEAIEGGSDLTLWFPSWPVSIAVGKKLTFVAYTDGTGENKKTYTREITVAGSPIVFDEGKINTLGVDMAQAQVATLYFSGGKGTAAEPWLIATEQDLVDMAAFVAHTEDAYLHFQSDCYRQVADIDFGGGTLPCIGNSNAASPYSFFKGVYEGNGFKVSNVVISNPNSNKAHGFFGYLDGNAHIDALVLENASISSTTWNDGLIAGCVQSTSTAVIENCRVTGGSVSAAHESVGGLVGKLMAGTVRGCSFQGAVAATNAAKNGCGGIVGYSSGVSCQIEDCHFSGTVSGAGQYVAGIVGKQDGGKILSCTVSGAQTQVSGDLDFVGGVVGYVTNNSNYRAIEGCAVNCLRVRGTRGCVGGLIGDIEAPATVNRCTARCDVVNETSGSDSNDKGCVGGLIGQIYDNAKTMVIANSSFTGGTVSNTASVKGNVGGLVGNANVKVMNYVTIFNCCSYPTGVSSGTSNQNIAGIAGYASDVVIRNCYSATPYTAYTFNGGVISPGSDQSNGCIYGWLRGSTSGEALSAVIKDAYWISGFKAGRSSGSYTYTKSEQQLSDAQMRNSGIVIRPSTAASYASFVEALNAAASDWAANPPAAVEALTWVVGPDGYPLPTGPAADAGTAKLRVSILGDSISTYQGYTPYPSNYQYPNASYADFTSVTQTWWHQLIYQKMDNACLEVNSSYTGTCVQETTDKGHPGLGFLHRYAELGDPDLIFINGGTNDSWSYHLPVGTLDFSLATSALDEYQFAQAYDKLIRLMKQKYPKAQIVCVIGDCVMDAQYSAYAQVIRDVCDHYGLEYAQVTFADRSASTYDSVHPNPSGMTQMADQIWDAVGSSVNPIPDLSARVVTVSSPRMKIYFPATQRKTCRMVIACPGGGYSSIPGADGYEGAYYKDLFNEAGYALAVLYYTLPGGDSSKPTGDIEAALNLVREKASRWYVDPDKVGVMGFSAGGHLASWAATHLSGNARADFQVLFYPVITMGDGTHAGSRNNLLGSSPSAAQIDAFSNQNHVTSSTPRTFLTYASNDTTVPAAQNGGTYYSALSTSGVPVTRCVYENVSRPHGWHWGQFIFDGVSQSDGTRFEYLDDVLGKLSAWLKSF